MVLFLLFHHVKVFVHSNCPGDLLVTSTSTGEQSTFPPTRFRTLTAGWGKGHDVTVWSTKLHVAFLPKDDYELSCKNESGEIVIPKYMKATFDGKTYQIRNNNNCCATGWYDMNWARPPPLCSPYVDQGSFQLPEVTLYQHYEANEFLHTSHVQAEVDGIKLWGANFGGAHFSSVNFGSVNFGEPGESRAVLLRWRTLTSYVRVKMTLEDGTVIGSVGEGQEGVAEIDIPPEISGIHEVIFKAYRFAGTHHFAKILSFEILPPLPTTSPTITSAPTISLVPTSKPTSKPTSSYVFIDCYADSNDRDLPVHLGNYFTHDQCHQGCSAQGYAYFGLQWKGQCSCGDSYGKHGTTSCVNDCKGTYFGDWKNCVYDVDGIPPPVT